MRTWGKVAASLVAAGLVTTACGGSPSDEGPTGGSPVASPTAAPPTTGRDLVQTGIEPVGAGSGEQGLVVDGSGAVWVDGPWQLARLDPSSGASQVWSVADDAAIGAIAAVAGASESGVWLVAGDHVLRFDGSRFAEDLVVPARYGELGSFAADGDRVWISVTGPTHMVTLEWRDGAWSEVGTPSGRLVVDADGALWSGGRQLQDDGSWVTPDESDAPPEGLASVTAADPRGGLWVLAAEDLYHYDGSGWTHEQVPAVPVADEGGGGWYVSSMGVSAAGDVWLAGDLAVLRRWADGGWTTYAAEQGLSDQPWSQGPRNIAVAGEAVLVTDVTGVLRFDGGTFVSQWRDPATDPVSAASCLRAVSGTEAHVVAQGTADAQPMLSRFADGTWDTDGPQVETCASAVGPDGTIWAVTGQGLFRSDGDSWITVDDTITSGPVAVGPDGVAWAISRGRLVRYGTGDGRTVIGTTPLGDARTLMLSSAQPGVVWVASNAWEAPQDAARWDGSWTEVPNDAWTMDIEATPDGALWAFASNNETGWLLRYANGTWTEVPGSRGHAPDELSVSPTGEVCGAGFDNADRQALVCFDAGGPTTTSLLPGYQVEISIAPDGSAWVLGEQLARLPDDALPWPVSAS